MKNESCVNIILSPNKLKLTYERFLEIPNELKQIPHWVCWKKVTGADGKITKVPINPHTLRYASTTDPKAWADYETSNRSYLRHRAQVDGLGFVFTKGSGLIGIDLDRVRDPEDGQLHPSLSVFLSRFSSYAELSQSGRGYHIILRGTLPEGWGNKETIDGMTVEVYDDKRYFVMTGEGRQRSIEPITDQALDYLRPYFEGKLSIRYLNDDGDKVPLTVTPEEEFGDKLIIEAFLQNTSEKVVRLFNGDTSAYGGDHSRADLALCLELACCCDTESELDRLFRKSALYRPKWERDSYRIPTLRKAMKWIEA